MLGWAVSSALIGCILGTFLAGAPSEKFGRRKLLLASAILFAISAIGVGASRSLNSFVAFRLVGGLGVGMASTLSPVYIAEVAPASIRGRFVSLNQLTIVVGILVAYFASYFLADIGHNNWRWMYAVEAIPAILFFIGLFFVPESPRWLIKKGRDNDALSIFKNIGGLDFAKRAISQVKKTLANKEQGRLKDLIRPELRFVVIIGIILAIFQQWCGINVIFFYAPAIFQKAGVGIHSALFRTILIGVVNLVFTIVAMWLIDQAGRKKLLLIGAGGMVVSYILIGICFLFSFSGFYLVLLVLFAVAFYAISLAPVIWVLISEIYPNRIRGVAMSVATFFLWVASFVLTLTFPILQKSIGDAYTFWLYAGICLAGWLFVLFFVPETKGKSLEELEEVLIKS